MAEFFDTYAPLLWIITTGLVVITLVWLAWLSFGREEVAGAEGVQQGEMEIEGQLSELLRATAQMRDSLAGTLQGVGLVRFDAYSDAGGQRSFSVVLADSQGNGVVISSLHGRANTRIFAKQLYLWESEIQLSDEELEAIEQARSQTEAAPSIPAEA